MERLNRTLIAKLAYLCKGNWADWDEKLLWALQSYRISIIYRIKASPFKLLFGREPRLLVENDLFNEQMSQKNDSGLIEIYENQDNLQEMARNLRKEESAKELCGTKKENCFEIGEIVMKRREEFERQNKLDSKWSGPYTVVRNFGNGGYEIMNPNGKLFRNNVKDLRKMSGTDPEEWLEVNEGEMLDAENEFDNQSLIIDLI